MEESRESLGRLPPLDAEVWSCGICKSLMVEPQTLPCLHSFCAECLQAHLRHPEPAPGSVKCPTCNSDSAAEFSSVQTNYFLKNAIEYLLVFSDHKFGKKCTFCSLQKSESVAVSVCITCKDLLCGACSNAHNLTTITRDHIVKLLSEVYGGEFERQVRETQQMPCKNKEHQYVLQYHCKTCNVLSCKDCVFFEHMRHEFTEIDELSKQTRGDILDDISRIDASCKELDKSSRDIEKLMKECNDRKTKELKDIASRKERYMKFIEEQAKQAEADVREIYSEPESKLKAQYMAVTEKLSSLQRTSRLSTLFAKNGNDVEIVSLKDTLEEHFGRISLKHEDCKDTKVPSVTLKSTETLPELFSVMERDATDQPRQQTPTVQDFSRSSSSSSVVVRELCDCRIKGDSHSPVISDVCWITNDSFAVADKGNEAAKVFDLKNGSHWKKSSSNIQHVACIYGVVAFDGEDRVQLYKNLIYNGVINVGQNARNPFVLAQGLDVNLVYFSAVKSQVLKVYKSDGRRESSTSAINLDKQIWPLCMTYTKEYFIIIDKMTNSIRRISRDGKVTDFYIHPGGKWSPTALEVDKDRNVYVVDVESLSLLKFSEDGKFVKSKELPLHGPIGLSLNTEGKFLIADRDGKVYSFTWN